MQAHHSIQPAQTLDIKEAYAVIAQRKPLQLSDTATEKIAACRAYLDEKMANSDQAFYGINTGFGSLCNVRVSKEGLADLQRNLLMSHACGTGNRVPADIIRLMLVLKIQSLSYGHSGVQVASVQRLIDMFNADVLPVVYQQGSLGASGDLAPLSHLCLPLLGLGEVYYEGEVRNAAEVLEQLGWTAIELQSKEGLALINGTQFMSAYGVWCLNKAKRQLALADKLAAFSLEAYNGRIDPFHPRIHEVRKQEGQIAVAANIRKLLTGSRITQQPKRHVQDPYSFRCVPQVHGASRDAVNYVSTVFEREINAVTDNPNIFVEEDLIVSGGNFHGQPLALALDQLSIAMAEIGNIAERRTYRLLNGDRDLPPFLVDHPGLHSGLMIPQYTAASIVSQNKQLAVPASIDSVSSCNEQEDHVSMGANAATKCYRILENIDSIQAIELLTAAQAFDFRRRTAEPYLTSSAVLEEFFASFRKEVSFISADRVLYTDIAKTKAFLANLDV